MTGPTPDRATLLREDEPVSRLQVDSEEVVGLYGQDLERVRRKFGMLFQNAALFDSMTVGENVAFPIKEHTRLSKEEIHAIVKEKLYQVGLKNVTGKMPSELSGGMRKRVGLARALALDPELLFLDEPTAGLDPIGAAAFDQLLLELQKNLNLTVFIVTHDLDTIHTVSNKIAVLGGKKLLINGSLEEVSGFDHPWVQDYFHGPRSRAVNH